MDIKTELTNSIKFLCDLGKDLDGVKLSADQCWILSDQITRVISKIEELETDKWISIKDQPLPTDPLIKIIRWNKIHKCSVSVFYYPKHDKKMPWCTGDLSHCWPEETFSPYWKPESEAPVEVIGL